MAVTAETKIKPESKDENKTNSCRPSELPIYTSKDEPKIVTNVEVEEKPGYIESVIRDIRVTVTKYSDEFKAYKRVGVEHVDKSMENIECKKRWLPFPQY